MSRPTAFLGQSRRPRTLRRFERWWAGLLNQARGPFAQSRVASTPVEAGETSPVAEECQPECAGASGATPGHRPQQEPPPARATSRTSTGMRCPLPPTYPAGGRNQTERLPVGREYPGDYRVDPDLRGDPGHRGQRPAGWRGRQIPTRRRSRAGHADGSGRAGRHQDRAPRSTSSEPRTARSPWSATASTRRPRSPEPTSESPSAPAPTRPSRPPTSCSCVTRLTSPPPSRSAAAHCERCHQDLGWAVGYNSLAIPIAAGVFEPLGFVLRPEVGVVSTSASGAIVAVNAIALKRLQLPDQR